MPKPRTPIRRQADPMTSHERIAHYYTHTGRKHPTPRQARRYRHKSNRAYARSRILLDALKG